MKIGIMTFHWATNYGAVLQTYALQESLKQRGFDVKVINYIPKRLKKTTRNSLCLRPGQTIKNLKSLQKERSISRFRQEYLEMTREYSSLRSLQKEPPACDVYVCGSDQIWNQWFTRQGEGGLTLSYFLAFGPPQIKRIAYAASFGCTEYPKDLVDAVLPYWQRFDAISVRETGGRAIMQRAGFSHVSTVPDPTMLLDAAQYPCERQSSSDHVFFYALHDNQKKINEIKKWFATNTQHRIIDSRDSTHRNMGVTEWLSCIKNASFVVTNSFHGAVFSVLFKKKFAIVSVENALASMNDRIETLCQLLQLKDCVVERSEAVEPLLSMEQNWTDVYMRLDECRFKAASFFNAAIK